MQNDNFFYENPFTVLVDYGLYGTCPPGIRPAVLERLIQIAGFDHV